VRRDASYAEDDTRMLNPVVGIEQQRANGADALLESLAHHRRKPIAADDLGVIIEKAEQFTLRLFQGPVVRPGEVVGTFVVEQDANLWLFPHRFEIPSLLWLERACPIDYEENLEMRIGSAIQEPVDARP
jgi:hypothetical protein